MNIKDIIVKYLKDNSFDGLFNGDGECACKLDDLIPCDGDGGILDCEPGVLMPCDCQDFPCYFEEDTHDFHIGRKKEGE